MDCTVTLYIQSK